MATRSEPVATPYCGRFAPSPTGPLHFGSLVAAVASYLQAHSNQGEWLVRIEDIDPPREIPGATSDILRCLDAHGFEYPPPLLQSSRIPAYQETINDLTTAGLTYPCTCSRRTIRESGAQRGRAGLIYRGTCREGHPPDPETAASVRVLTRDAVINFTDALQGPQSCRLSAEIGDFMIRRADGLVAYQLAVTVDDHNQGITEVVRGIDLLDSTFMQIHLQHLLGLATPQYMHVPVVTTDTHDKLSKQTGAPPVDPDKAVKNIYQALVFLEQNPEPSLLGATLREIWRWAEAHWNPANLSGLKQKQYRSMILR